MFLHCILPILVTVVLRFLVRSLKFLALGFALPPQNKTVSKFRPTIPQWLSLFSIGFHCLSSHILSSNFVVFRLTMPQCIGRLLICQLQYSFCLSRELVHHFFRVCCICSNNVCWFHLFVLFVGLPYLSLKLKVCSFLCAVPHPINSIVFIFHVVLLLSSSCFAFLPHSLHRNLGFFVEKY